MIKLQLAQKTHLTGNVWSFKFACETPLIWVAGQFIKLGIDHPRPDEEGTTRFFTISAAPYEELLTICTRVTQTSFKQALAQLPIGGHADLIDSPAGDFIWLPSSKPHIFAAQGIGITPFYAIIKDRIHRQLPVNAKLIYAHKPGTQAVFEQELREWAELDPTLELQLQTEYISVELIAQAYPDLTKHIVYVSGPKSLTKLCLPPHNLPLSQLQQDNFPGYAAANY